MESNIHAREWITSATATWLLNELLTSTDPVVQVLSNEYDWIIVPIVNVDGYIYTQTVSGQFRTKSFVELTKIQFYRTEHGEKLDRPIHCSVTEPIRIETLIPIGFVST